MRAMRVAGIFLLLVVGACSDAKPAATTSSSSRAATSLVVPVGSSSSDFWVASDLPNGYQLVYARDAGLPGAEFHTSGYLPTTATVDAFDANLMVDSMPTDSQAGFDVQSGAPTTVRGHPATLATMTDEGHAYGVALSWEERSGLRLVVRAAEPLTEADARLVANAVQPVSEDTWHKLSLATDPVAVSDGRVTSDMQRVLVASGVEDGDAWQLTALLPAGFPLLDLDRRAACFELAYRGATTNGTSCIGHPSWERIGRRIFLIGEVPADTARVRVAPDSGPAFEVDTAAAAGWSSTRFFAAPLPEGTCLATIEPTTGSSQGASFGTTGPLDEPSTHEDWLRCLGGAPTPPTTPGAAPPPVSTPPTSN